MAPRRPFLRELRARAPRGCSNDRAPAHRLARLGWAVAIGAGCAAWLGCERDAPELATASLAERAAKRFSSQLEAASPPAVPRSPRDRPTATPSDGEPDRPPPGYVHVRARAQLDAEQGNALLLVDETSERVVPIFVGNTEALSIRLRLAGEQYVRPLTHDLLDATLRRLGARLSSVQIDELRGSVFIGTLVLRDRDGQRIALDARPSDVVAMAIGNDAPIFMARKVLERAGYRIEDLGEIERGGSRRAEEATPL